MRNALIITMAWHKNAVTPVAPFTKEVAPWLAKRPFKTNGRLTNLELTSLVKKPLSNWVTAVLR